MQTETMTTKTMTGSQVKKIKETDQATTQSDVRIKMEVRRVELIGLSDIMFDRYPGDNDTKLEWVQKIYTVPGLSQLVLPSENISSFLSGHNTNSAPKRLLDARKYKAVCNACLSFVQILGPDEHPQFLPFTRDGEPIEVGTFGVDRDETSGLYLHRSVARLEKGIPNPKERPTLPLPWSLTFILKIFPNKEINEQQIKNLFEQGGIAVGLGTFRGVFGKFAVNKWEEVEA
jgi:hypothetical protein